MHVDRRFLGWGVFFIVAGGVALAVRAGALSADQVSQVWRLWPLVLVALGVAIVLARTPLGWLGGILVAATFGLLAGSAFSGGLVGPTCGFDLADRAPGSGAETTVDGQLAEGASVALAFDCGALNVTTAPGTAWSLAYRQDRVPRVDATPQALDIRAPEGSFLGGGSDWRLSLPDDPRFALDVTANGASVDLRLANARLSRFKGTFNAGSFVLDLSGADLAASGGLDVQVNAGSGSLRLPDSSFGGRVDVNAGSLEVCVAEGTGLHVVTSGALASTDFSSSGLVATGSTWESPGYATPETKIELTLSANAASVTVRRDGGCS